MLDVCNGRFSVLEIILEDRLYKTVDTATGSLAAVKRWESGDSSFENELSALTSLRHPSVPQFICSFEEGGFSLGGLVFECAEKGRKIDLSFDAALEDLEGRFSEITGFSLEGADGQ